MSPTGLQTHDLLVVKNAAHKLRATSQVIGHLLIPNLPQPRPQRIGKG
jgi:hypothetical protein